jgi:hypothetical protein
MEYMLTKGSCNVMAMNPFILQNPHGFITMNLVALCGEGCKMGFGQKEVPPTFFILSNCL